MAEETFTSPPHSMAHEETFLLDLCTALPLLATALVTGSIRQRAAGIRRRTDDFLLVTCVTSAFLGVAGMIA